MKIWAEDTEGGGMEKAILSYGGTVEHWMGAGEVLYFWGGKGKISLVCTLSRNSR